MTTALERKGCFLLMTLALAVASLPALSFGSVQAKASQDGRTLTIVGDGEANDVAVVLAAGDALEVSDGGVPIGAFSPDAVEAISIRLGGGADSLAVLLSAQNHLRNLRRVSVRLGAGDDVAVIEVNPGVQVSVSGGKGHDVVSGAESAPSAAFRSVDRESFEASPKLFRGGRGGGLGYSCTNGTCTCDKSVENDCEDMSAECTDATVDALINCINGWLTTHCTCTKRAAVRGSLPGRISIPVNGGFFLAR
jgi:hypothetical protein